MTDAPAPVAEETGPPPPAPDRPPFRRTADDDRVIGGVAGGVARTLAIDPVLVRIGAVVLGVAFPPFVLAYVATWLLAPEDGTAPSENGSARGLGWWVGIVLAAGVSIALIDQLDNGGAPLVALALGGIGVALWNRPTAGQAPPRTSVVRASAGTDTTVGIDRAGSDSDAPAAGPGTSPGDDDGTGGVPPTAPTPAPVPWTPPPLEPRTRSSLGPLTLGLSLVAAGVTVALDTADIISVDVTQVLAVALAVVGIGLLVGTVLGRARWLALVAFVLTPVVLIGSGTRGLEDITDLDLSIIDQLEAGVGERRVVVDDADDLDELDELVALGIGSLRVDLEDYEATDDETLMLDQGIGELTLILPAGARYRVTAAVGAGEMVVREPDGSRTRTGTTVAGGAFGTDFERADVVLTGGPATGPLLELDVELGIGELELIKTDTEVLR